MNTTITKSPLLYVSIMIFCVMFVNISLSAIDIEDSVTILLFDEGNGNTVQDSSANDNSGTIHGGAEWVNGKFGKALQLDGTDDYVEIDHHESLNVGAEHTIAFWYKLSKVPAGGMAVVTKDDWAPGFWWDGNMIRHHTHNPGGSLHYIDAAWNPDTEWHHVAATYDGEEFGIYLDAKQIGSGVTAANLGRNPLTDKPFLFGIYLETGQHAQWGEFFSGIVDDFVIFNTVLSENDLDTLMNQGLEQTADIEPAGKLTTTWSKIKGY